MSHNFYKTKYTTEGAYGSLEEHTLYAHHNNTVGMVLFYNEKFNLMFIVDETQNNIFQAISRLYAPDTSSGSLDPMVKGLEPEEILKIRAAK